MITYLIRRILLVIPTLVGMTMLVFFVMALSPGGAGADLSKGEGMRPEERRALQKYLNERYGLDKPLHVQYFRWLNRVSPVGLKVKEDGSYGAPTIKVPSRCCSIAFPFRWFTSPPSCWASTPPASVVALSMSPPARFFWAFGPSPSSGPA
jgi:Binding-prot-dependent transport system membrane comp, N-term